MTDPGNQTTDNQTSANESVNLAHKAAEDDVGSRQQINEIVHPMISYQADRFCKRFCHNNKYYFQCSLPRPWGSPPSNAPLCEWGNASYGWMLDDLTNARRLRNFRGDSGVRINDYLFTIANSLPFYERWKEWRFGKRLHVPTYIQDLHEHAAPVFIGLYKKGNTAEIAQANSLPEQIVAQIAQQIIVTLAQRNKLYLLDSPQTISLSDMNTHSAAQSTSENSGLEADIAYADLQPEQQEVSLKLSAAWGQLSVTEQFVIEAMIIEEQEASDVLNALQKLGICINEDIPADQTNRQQLYYFRRKTLAKLAKLMGDDASELL